MKHRYRPEDVILVEKSKHGNFRDLDGRRFARLLVIGFAGRKRYRTQDGSLWWCRCDCGSILKVDGGSLNSRATTSCGCHHKECLFTHGMTDSPEYASYRGAKDRCDNTNNPAYHRYGGRGIRFLFSSFEEFFTELGEKPQPKRSYGVDRIDNNGHYQKGNVRWATAKEQTRNFRRNHHLTYNEETRILEDWSIETGLSPSTLLNRIASGWCTTCTLTLPPIDPSRPQDACKHRPPRAYRNQHSKKITSQTRKDYHHDKHF